MTSKACKCTVRGSINCDEYFHVTHIVRPGETLSSHGHERRVGGKGANQAAAVVRAGGRAHFYGTIGNDGTWVRNKMQSYGVEVQGIIVSDEPTGRAIIQVDHAGENSIILFPGANHSELHERIFAQKQRGWFPETTHLLLQNEINMASTYYALFAAKDATIVMNPSPLPSRVDILNFHWHFIDWLVLNETEAHGIYEALIAKAPSSSRSSPGNETPAAPVMPTRELVSKLSTRPRFENTNIICTLGADGVLAFIPTFHRPKSVNEAPSFMHVPAIKLIGGVKDSTGAGDCFTGYFVQGLMEFGPNAKVGKEIKELDIAKILKTCVYASGMCVERPGTIDSIPTRAQVEARMASGI